MATHNPVHQPQVTKALITPHRSALAAVLKPDHRQLAIQYFFLSLALLLFGLITFAAQNWITAFHPQTITPPSFPTAFANANISALALSFGLFGLIFGALGNLITPLQTGAGERFHINFARCAWWCYLIGLISLIANIGPRGITQSNHSALLLAISGIALASSMKITGIHFLLIARSGRCNGMTAGRIPVAARTFIQLSILLILAGALAAFVMFIFPQNNDNAIATKWANWFSLRSDHTFWIFTAYNLIGLSFFALLATAFDAAAPWARQPLRSRTIPVLSNLIGAFAFFCWNIFQQFDNPVINTTASILFIIAIVAAAVSCFMLFASAIPRTFRPHPGLYFVWALPVFFFLSLLSNSPSSRIVAVLLPGICAAIYYWFPRFRRRNLNQTVGRLHFYMTTIALLFLLISPSVITTDSRLQLLTAVALMMLIAAQFPFIINTVASSCKYGNRIFIYTAILLLIEIIARLFPNTDHGLISWIWQQSSVPWPLRTIMTMTTLAVMVFIDWRLLKAFPPKRKHPRPNRWVAIMTLATSIPLFLMPLILSNTLINISTGWAWSIIIASSIIGFAYSFKRGNRITFGDDIVDNLWRANSLEWYERTPNQIERGINAYEPDKLTVYRHAYHYEKSDKGEDHTPQWLPDNITENSTS